MHNLTPRQEKILQLIREKKGIQTQELQEYFKKIVRVTLIRDLNELRRQNLIERSGKGRGVSYKEKIKHPLLRDFSVDSYFKKDVDERAPKETQFNFQVFNELHDLFSAQELKACEKANKNFQKALKNFSPTLLKKEFERMTIELAWKSSKIEGNTYSLLDTEALLKERIEAKNHTKEETQMLINHKLAFDYILKAPHEFEKLHFKKLMELHTLLVQQLGVATGIRKRLVGITGTNYKPLDNEFQIREALDELIKVVNKVKHPIEKAFIAFAMLAYIQAFEDGNKRTSRLSTNALLLGHDFCPLSFRSIEVVDYKKAVILFYEQNSLIYLKELFLDQFHFATQNYFRA